MGTRSFDSHGQCECMTVPEYDWVSFDSVWLYLTVIHSHCPCESKDLFPNTVCCEKIQHQHNRTLKTTSMGICAAALATVPSLTPWKHLVWTAVHKMVVWLTLRFVMESTFSFSIFYPVLFFYPLFFWYLTVGSISCRTVSPTVPRENCKGFKFREMFLQIISSEPFKLLWPNLVWWCIIINRSVVQEKFDCYLKCQGHSEGSYNQLWQFLTSQQNCWCSCNKA